MELDYFKKYSSYKEEQNNNKNVWLYTRVSSKDQFETNGSIENQKNAANLLAQNKYVITKTFGGTYESAKGDFTRKEFNRLISEVKKAKHKPFAILIYKMSRFSRTGGSAIGLVNKLINVHGVHLIEVSTNKDTTTPRGEYEIIESLQYARKENIERLEYTIPGMIAFLKKGNWLGKAPRGYDHYGDRVKNIEFKAESQKLEINYEGRLLKKAWKWKLKDIPDYKICKKLEALELIISKQSLSEMWRKPFYCGINTNSLLKGEAIKGNWKSIVSKEDFRIINDRLDGNRNTGYTKSKFCEDRPLQSDLYCGNCGTKMTGYKAKKKYDYYKCQNKSCTCRDMNAKSSKKSLRTGLNDLFEDYLSQYCLDRKFVEVFKAQMKLIIADKNKESIELESSLNKQLKELGVQKDNLERKYAFDNLKPELFDKFDKELTGKIEALNVEKSKLGISISNLNKKIEKCVEVTQNISDYWKHGSIENKVRVQKLVFPSGIVIDPKNLQYRTSEVNSVFSVISSIVIGKGAKSKNASSNLDDASRLVAGTGLEPVTFGL
ncbi:recombinase family protein [Galbibacter sp.]|uniref:recombinase family protein n=1 Tax=Galbibacter sp. TaxID=2918471 RepID=UPI003A8FEA58